MLALPGMAAVMNPADEAQVRSAEDRAVFEGKHADDPDWIIYFDLVEHGWPWRKAAYIAWAMQPRDRRAIHTEGEFAVKELGLTSARQIREWKAEPEFLQFIKDLARNELAAARMDIYAALIEAASNPNPRNHPDRKTALTMLGDYEETFRLGPALPDDLSQLSVEEKRARLAELRKRQALDGAE